MPDFQIRFGPGWFPHNKFSLFLSMTSYAISIILCSDHNFHHILQRKNGISDDYAKNNNVKLNYPGRVAYPLWLDQKSGSRSLAWESRRLVPFI